MIGIIKDRLIKTKAKKILIFGFFARSEEKSGSNIDIVVKLKERKSILGLVGFGSDLSEMLGIKVYLLIEKTTNPYILDKIKNDLMDVYQ